MNNSNPNHTIDIQKKIKLTIGIVSFAIPLVVLILILLPIRPQAFFDLRILPAFHAILNSATSLLLLISLYAIKNGKISLHKTANLFATVLSCLFLISYVIYHLYASSTKYGDLNKDGILDLGEKELAGGLRYFYYFILLTHILFAIIVIPFVLYSLVYAHFNQFEKHKKISKYTWLIWFYVSITGVLVYLLIQKFY